MITWGGRLRYQLPSALALVLLPLLTQPAVSNGPDDPGSAKPSGEQQIEFFESRIQPVLVEHCYECHNSTDTAEGELAVDWNEPLVAGGDSGPGVVPGEPEKSLLLQAIRHEIEGLEMPSGGPKLDEKTISDFEHWIDTGALDPRNRRPSADELAADKSWDSVLQRRRQWWSFQPIENPEPPPIEDPWASHPIDRFVLKELRDAGLEPSDPAEPATLVRRLYFNLIGLPPTVEEAARWTERLENASSADRDAVVAELVDTLLANPRFGERWARHWLDWIRYAESHGSEGDPEIAQAWRYRDYLVRALNADVPVDQLLREHVAGDLLDSPRINESLGINESVIGPAHWRMVFHGFAPTDALDEKVRFVDDQINAFSKAFLGLTVSCARCHDHKFDAISQQDYYALFGVLGSCRPGRTVIDLPDRLNRNRKELESLKPQVRKALAEDWLHSTDDLEDRIAAEQGLWQEAEQAEAVLHPLHAIGQQTNDGASFDEQWQRLREQFEQQRARAEAWQASDSNEASRSGWQRWNLADTEDHADWFRTGGGLHDQPDAAGEFAVAANGDDALTGIYPAGVYTHSWSAKQAARLTSADVPVGEDQELWLRVIGDEGASARYVVHDYPRRGTVYPVTALENDWRWQRYDLDYWSGDEIHVELSTAADAPLLVGEQARSWFGIRQAVLKPKGAPSPKDFHEHLAPVFAAGDEHPPASWNELAAVYVDAVRAAIDAWKHDRASDAQALLLDASLREGLLPNQLQSLPSAQPLILAYRKLESAIPVPTRVPGLEETVGQDQPLFDRGDHRQPGEEVPRRFLEAIDATPYQTALSGRRELAEDLLREDNPLTRRVLVNRLWHHLFGRGIVSTPDNFGRLGDQPSHPKLLDWLARRFEEERWSLQKMIRLIVTSRTWQLSSQPTPQAGELDPDNRLHSHANLRRLEAEAIRDALLTVSGRIEHQLGGAPVNGNSPRRSIYVQVHRNSLNPFLRTFDFPEPFSAVGRRDVTNVPAQSLTMLNDPQITAYAESWARRVGEDRSLTDDEQRITEMFQAAFSRPPSKTEVARARDYLDTTRKQAEEDRRRLAGLQQQIADRRQQNDALKAPVRERLLEAQSRPGPVVTDGLPQPIAAWTFSQSVDETLPWSELARAIFTFQEFIYVR